MTRPLRPRELEILHHIAAGLNDPQIARHLYLGESTVKTHVRTLREALQATSRAHIVHLAHQTGILTAPTGLCCRQHLAAWLRTQAAQIEGDTHG